MATVIGPTPPGTGVMKPALSFTPAGNHRGLVTFSQRIKHLIRASSHKEMGIFTVYFLHLQSRRRRRAGLSPFLDPGCGLCLRQ